MKRLSAFEVFLITLIILNILDFFEFIPSAFDYVKKIISWTMLGYMLFQASPSHVFFGPRTKWFDISFIFACFFLVVKNLVSYAYAIIDEAPHYMLSFFDFLLQNSSVIELYGFIIGITSLVILSFLASAKIEFHKRSLMGVLGESGKHQHKFFIFHVLTCIVVFLAFFLFVFNLVMEWLAIAVDATLLLGALFFYSFFLVKHSIGFTSLVDKVGEVGDSFYQKFLDHFRYKESLMLGVVGLLVLHLVTDIGIFLVPYITSIADPLYFSSLGPGHEHIWTILFSDLSGLNVVDSISTIIIFFANIIGYLFLFISPAFMWYLMYHGKKTILPRKSLILFYVSLPAAVLNPLFAISSMNSNNFVGVDVTTKSLLGFPPLITVATMIVAFVFLRGATHHRRSKRILEHTWVAICTLFFAAYTWFFFSDMFEYYKHIIMSSINSNIFMATIFFIFEILTLLFYIGGFILFLFELGKHHSGGSKEE